MQVKPIWQEIPDFVSMARKIIEKYPQYFSGIDADWLVAYGVVNKDRPKGKSKPYEMSGEKEPECFTNSKKYFIKFYMSEWEARNEEGKYWLVISALERIDHETPESGKVAGYDYKDQCRLVRTLGPDWHSKGNLPHPLRSTIELVDKGD